MVVHHLGGSGFEISKGGGGGGGGGGKLLLTHDLIPTSRAWIGWIAVSAEYDIAGVSAFSQNRHEAALAAEMLRH